MRARASAAALVLGLASALLAGCPEVPAPGASAGTRARAPRNAARLEPGELLPADLDLVVRLDVSRMRLALGPAAADELAERALTDESDALLLEAARRADIVWLGLRLADLDAGDRVLAFEGRMRGLRPDPGTWATVPTDQKGVALFDRRGAPPRAGVGRVVALGDRALLFVSPVEVSSVARVMRDGADERRGDPSAEGLLSLDLRAGRLPPSLERRFPSISSIIAGIERIRASSAISEEGAELEAEILARTPQGAGRARRFLEVLRDNARDLRYAEIMKALAIEQVERTVRIRWTVPSRVVLALISGEEAG